MAFKQNDFDLFCKKINLFNKKMPHFEAFFYLAKAFSISFQ